MKRLLVVFLTVALTSCGGSPTIVERSERVKDEAVERYLASAEHLSETQRKAFEQGRPFVGMTEKEAELSMTPGEVQARLDGKILRGRFSDRAGREYVLRFDCGTPNRVASWSAFTDAELRELTTFRDVHPCPPLPQLWQ